MRTYRAGRRAKSVDQLASVLAHADSRSKIETAFAMAMRRFGGVGGFAREWWEHYQFAAKEAPGSRRVLNMHLAMARMCELAQASRPKTDYSLLSDEDLEREQERRLLELIAAKPEIAVWAACKLGWNVIPPG